MPNQYLQIDGVATYVHHTGETTLPGTPPRRGKGHAVVCLHGAGGNGHLFADLMSQLEAFHTVIAFDQPGHGRSGSLDSLGQIEAMAEFTERVLNELELSRAVLLGHEMGAAIALQATLNRPQQVAALILCSAGSNFAPPEKRVEQMRRVRDGKEKRPFDPTAFASKTSPEIMKKAFMEGMKTDPRATFGDLLACQQWTGQERLSEILTPTLVVNGAEDREAILSTAPELTQKLKTAQLEILEGTGHTLLLESPKAVGHLVQNFLERVPA
ncbi:MAG: alpha/beta hydrolase [Myxococcota bacterium]|nr:alpha/beta hydrolase [Myxococcota bacterium]